MLFMNTYEIDEAIYRFRLDPVLGPAARILGELRDLANETSDGWCYWPKPANAARLLMELLQRRAGTSQEVRHALSPIRAFLTRNRVALGGRTINLDLEQPQR